MFSLHQRSRSILGLTAVICFVLALLYSNSYTSPSDWPHRLIPDRFTVKRPPPQPYSAVFVYLARPSATSDLIKSLELLDTNLPTRSQWPIILFHTGDYDGPAARELLVERLHEEIDDESRYDRIVARLEYEKLEWKLPEGIPNDVNLVDPVPFHRDRWPGKPKALPLYDIHELNS